MTAAAERRTTCLRFESRDGTVIRIAPQYPHDLIMSNGETYFGGIRATVSGRNSNANGGANVVDLGSVYDADVVTRDEIQSGKWDDGLIFEFATDWANPVEDEEEINCYTMGKVSEEDDRFKLELMGLKDRLNQTIVRTITPTCIWTFADTHINGQIIATDKSRCKLLASTYTVTGTITSVTSASVFQDSSRAESLDYFGNGEIIFTSGDNAGLSHKIIKSYLADGTITVSSPFYYLPKVGDGYTMIAGCRKRPNEDCRDKFFNKKRFGGFPDVPTESQVTQFGTV